MNFSNSAKWALFVIVLAGLAGLVARSISPQAPSAKVDYAALCAENNASACEKIYKKQCVDKNATSCEVLFGFCEAQQSEDFCALAKSVKPDYLKNQCLEQNGTACDEILSLCKEDKNACAALNKMRTAFGTQCLEQNASACDDLVGFCSVKNDEASCLKIAEISVSLARSLEDKGAEVGELMKLNNAQIKFIKKHCDTQENCTKLLKKLGL